MSDDFIEFSEGAGQSDIAPGTYLVQLSEISEIRTIVPKVGPKAGQERDLRDWTFHTEDDQEIRDSAAVSSSPRSKQYQWVTALLGGTPAPIGQRLSLQSLIGREAIATIEINENGWPKIANLSAKPQSRRAAVAAKPPAQPVAAGVADDDLPF